MATRPSTAPEPQAEKLRQIHTIPALVQYLHDELGWPVNVEDWEDNLFDWQPEELNLKAEHEVKVKSIKQLRPLVSNQPWGIFFVEFNKGHLPVTALRRVLNCLVPKGRASTANHQTWAAHDLLFITSFGESNAREIALAHFTDESNQGDLPTLRVLGWDDDDTPMQLGYVAKTLSEKLRWPANTNTPEAREAWHQQWASAFALSYRQGINDSKTLALALAELAKRIRRRVNTVLALENEKGHLRQMHKAFKDNLIADLSDDDFADMFAQTITYGLFTARASRSSGALVADNLADMVPSTNPFLKELLGSFLSAAGRARSSAKRVDFDELGINEVVTVLREVSMDAVLRSFNTSKPGDDPVIHFYEDFLKAYDKAMRAKRGVFYTPSPVVQFIVRSVDEILKTEFGIEDGLASTITWGEMMARKPELKLPKFCTAATPFVQVLDPATGTGTFIVEVITQIHAHMLGKWAKQGKVTKAQWQPLWVDYVKLHLLPRLYAFELMMAPYAIAHMKIGLKLAETGYTFPEDGPRVNVFLTNALEPAHAINPELAFEAPMLAHEAAAANRVKEQLAATVVVGNPPYSVSTSNKGDWIVGLCADYKKDLNEKNIQPLSDDYVKFIRLGQYVIDRTGEGVLGYIINNSFIDGIIHRRMRQNLMASFCRMVVLDLHGSTKKNETTLDGQKDENVFDIMQGVDINVFVKTSQFQDRVIQHSSLQGLRTRKYAELLKNSLSEMQWTAISPVAPDYSLIPRNNDLAGEYGFGMGIDTFFKVSSSGIKSHRDDLVTDINPGKLAQRIKQFFDTSLQDEQVAEMLNLKDNRDWSLRSARLGEFSKTQIKAISYRPFDTRSIYYDSALVDFDRRAVMQHMLVNNMALVGLRQSRSGEQETFFVSKSLVNKDYVSLLDTCTVFPLWLDEGESRSTNLLQSCTSLFKTAVTTLGSSDGPKPKEIFDYLYAVLHSPAYRQRYAAFLRTDFPRIPIPGSRSVFDALSQLGSELVSWHLLEHADALEIGAPRVIPADGVVWFGADYALVKVAEKSRDLAELEGADDPVGKLYINATSGFSNVHTAIWQHTIGGYQVLHKWLDDRRKAGRSLSPDDVTHWLRVYAALQATQNLMPQIDEAIEANGGWPAAFSQNHPPPTAEILAKEQIAHKAQIKAQKKFAAAAQKSAARTGPMSNVSLFDSDGDLDAMAAASGAPPLPKAKATSANAVGGKTVGSPTQVNGLGDGQVMCVIRSALATAGALGLTRDDLIRAVARGLGFARTLPAIRLALDSAIRRAVRRGIASNTGGVLTLWVKGMDGYERDHLRSQLLLAIRAVGGACDKADAPMLLARSLGFARTGSNISALVNSVLQSLIRAKRVESKAGQIRVI